MRRSLLALGTSLLIHGALVAGAVGYAAWQGLTLARNVEVVPITLESVKELPLGPPPTKAGAKEATGTPRPRRRSPPKVAARGEGTVVLGGPDAGADAQPEVAAAPAPPPDAGPAEGAGKKPGDLRAYGPEGSRLTALLRLDRLRAAPEGKAFIAPVDEILRLLPDRRRLLEGTGLDLYRDFDALLIATPNPFDDAVTFLAARHHLDDARFRASLDRGAVAAGRPIQWREEAGRPVGVRTRRKPAPPPAAPAASPAAPGEGTPVPAPPPPPLSPPPPIPEDRDDRLFVLPQVGLAVIAPPAYARLLLDRGDGGRSHDGGASPARPVGGRRDWRDLVARIDAEDGTMPENAVFMMTATNLLRSPGRAPSSGTDGESGAPGPAAVTGAMPGVLSIVAGMTPTPFVELTAEFASTAQARLWEGDWPSWKKKLLGNPLVLLAGLNPIISRADLERDDRTIVLRTTATAEETRRILQMVVNFVRPGGGPPSN